MAQEEKQQEGVSRQALLIKAPDFRTVVFKIRGTAPLVINRMSNKVTEQMRAKQEAGDTSKSRKKREQKDFAANCKDALHVSTDGWCGFAASSIRNGCISACRAAGYVMTKAKLAIFVVPDGFDAVDGIPLVRINGDWRMNVMPTRNQTGVVDLRARPWWDEWSADVHVRFDAEMLTVTDVTNLMARVGMQVGIGEGRPDSKNSCGMGWGTFAIVND